MAPPSSVAEVGTRFADLQAEYVADALALLDQALRRGRSSPDAWRAAVQSIGDRLLLIQVGTATWADAYLNDVIEAQDADGASEGRVYPQAFADLNDGGGSWLQSLVYAPNSVRDSHPAWWTRFAFVAGSIVKTGLGDTARAATQSAMQTRPAVRGYVRMMRGKSCARCAILAGRVYRSSRAFRRHPRCDCIHIPTAEDGGEDWATDTNAYFRALDTADQDRLFTKAGAEAIRLGADPAQVVNAQAGVTVAQAYGQQIQVTTVGTTSRGLAGQRLGPDTPRLLPDEIFQLAERFGWDRAEVLRQLRRFAYVL